MPLVSVCLPVYNGEKYLKEALDSLVNQTYKNMELIVSDDNSKDNSMVLINDFSRYVDFPVYIYTHLPNGIGENWNHCVEKANGAYIKFLFQDDILGHDCIEKMVALAESNSKIGLVYCKRDIIYNSHNTFHRNWIKEYSILHQSWHNLTIRSGEIIEGSKLVNNLNLLRFPENKVGEPTAVLLKRECFDKIGYFDNELKQALDIEYWYRVMKNFSIVFIDEPLVKFRLHDEQATFVNSNDAINETDLLEFKIYKNLFWKLNTKVRYKYFLKFNFFGKKIVFFQEVFRGVKRKINRFIQ